jgi:antitoxin (DNA-binding transcriptional repressor) of toxin-antitoxin stability system
MSVRVTVHQLQEQLPQLLDLTVGSGQECIIERDGEEYAIIVSAGEWRRRSGENGVMAPAPAIADEEEARSEELGRRLDTLGPEYRLSLEEQGRMEELLARKETTPLTPAERYELEALVERCDEIMLRRAQALRQVL